ncbi:disease resistance protein Roq1-like [Lycium barbarum]|uniref:disease resistance protein Roq1-like n=1 Tax=Lycium barbarum TaxID=112863 RepID=UPI00293F5273|nr:disease resistance protein Roq1-like [Lycium barbarum]
MFPSLSELNLSRNKFVSLKNMHLPMQLHYLNITYCEELKESPELPPDLRELYADDFLAQDCVNMFRYRRLYLISFTNSSYEQLYSDKSNNSSLMDENCQQEIIHNTLVKILITFFKYKQAGYHDGMPAWSVVYPERVIPKWFTYHSTLEKISLHLPKNWWNDDFLGFVVCCSTYMGDGVYCPDWTLSGIRDSCSAKKKKKKKKEPN